MKLSIIIPIHNGERFIARCLDALLNQTVDVDEIILVNDHSSDRTEELCRSYASRYDSIKYIESQRYGVSAARNIGLDFVKGDIIGFCDIDDIEKESMAEVVKQEFENNSDLRVFVTGYERVNCEDTSDVLGIYRCTSTSDWSKEDYLKHAIYDENVMGTVWCKFFSSSLIYNLRFNESLSLCEDMDFTLRAMTLCSGKSLAASDEITYQYSFNPKSVTNDESKLFDENHNELKYNEAFFLIAKNEKLSKDVKEYLYYKVFCFSIAILSYYVISDARRDTLKRHLREYFTVFFKLFMLEPKENIKRCIKCLFRIRRGRPFCW